MTIKQMAVRLPRLLDKDLNEVKRLRARSQSVELNITPLSTASMMLEDGSGVGIRSFVEIYNANGSVGVFRVSMPEESYGSGERIMLEHGICTLDDATVHGKGEIVGTPREVLEEILGYQTTKARGQKLWTVGTVEAPGSMQVTVEYDGTKTLEALLRYIGKVEGYRLAFDQSVFPWRVNVVKKPDTAACEGRLSRNIRTIRKTMDDSDLCTRLYCSLLDGGYIESDTVGAWGVVEKEITLNDDMDAADVSAYCRKYIENRKNPVLAVQMDASEWFAMTGERLDRFEIGDLCRLALPEYGVVIEERIVSVSYMDALGSPEAVTVSLANQVADMSIRTAEMQSQIDSLKGSSTGHSNQILQANTTIAHLKEENEGFKEVDNKMVKWFSSAQINLDATEAGANVGILATYQETYDLFEGVDTRVTEAELILHGGPDGAQAGLIARVDDNEASILATATDVETLVTIKADAVYVDAQITAVKKLVASEIEAAVGDIGISISNNINTKQLSVTGTAEVGALKIKTMPVSTTTIPVVTSFTQASGESATTTKYAFLTTAVGDETECKAENGETVTF